MSSGEKSLIVWLNPFFADSMSVETGNDWAAGADVPTARPGTKDNPYGVRSIHQLQFINWNHKNQNTSTVLYNTSSNQQDFMYLSYVAQTLWGGSNEVDRTYYWLQTHDLDGSDVEEYTPIAAFRDETPWTMETGAMAYGWFGGSYNGNDYTIQNLNIYTEKINTTGLFGFTLDAELQNIILYAPEGDGLIRSYSPEGDNNWYAVGALVGLAANTAGSDRVISNCAVAGYVILDDNGGCAYGGGGVGGLVGICNMALENCTAVTDIRLNFTHSDSARNVRAGGLVGSCQRGITNCYAGGSIQADLSVKQRNSRVHAGGIVGGLSLERIPRAPPEGPILPFKTVTAM